MHKLSLLRKSYQVVERIKMEGANQEMMEVVVEYPYARVEKRGREDCEGNDDGILKKKCVRFLVINPDNTASPRPAKIEADERGLQVNRINNKKMVFVLYESAARRKYVRHSRIGRGTPIDDNAGTEYELRSIQEVSQNQNSSQLEIRVYEFDNGGDDVMVRGRRRKCLVNVVKTDDVEQKNSMSAFDFVSLILQMKDLIVGLILQIPSLIVGLILQIPSLIKNLKLIVEGLIKKLIQKVQRLILVLFWALSVFVLEIRSCVIYPFLCVQKKYMFGYTDINDCATYYKLDRDEKEKQIQRWIIMSMFGVIMFGFMM